MISHVKQGKFKVGVVPANGLGRLLLIFLYLLNGVVSAMSAGANTTNFRPI
jgi:hypothetical protein